MTAKHCLARRLVQWMMPNALKPASVFISAGGRIILVPRIVCVIRIVGLRTVLSSVMWEISRAMMYVVVNAAVIQMTTNVCITAPVTKNANASRLNPSATMTASVTTTANAWTLVLLMTPHHQTHKNHVFVNVMNNTVIVG